MQLSKHTKRFEQFTLDELIAERDRLFAQVEGDSDFAVDSLMDHIYANPLGKLLQIIATLPEVRHEKVEDARRIVDEPEEQLDCRMDLALDRVLEEIITGN